PPQRLRAHCQPRAQSHQFEPPMLLLLEHDPRFAESAVAPTYPPRQSVSEYEAKECAGVPVRAH
ncbi:MAG: hypothetical protein KBF76_17080, partial [Verrucomicrobiales bacterium]|nr:hypothetical protein [Verrucomicrobiales bacterium]